MVIKYLRYIEIDDMEEKETIRDYLELISEYTDGEMDAHEFSIKYSQVFKKEERSVTESTFQILDYLFAEADSYCEPELREDTIDAINEEELMAAARKTTKKLEQRLTDLDDS